MRGRFGGILDSVLLLQAGFDELNQKHAVSNAQKVQKYTGERRETRTHSRPRARQPTRRCARSGLRGLGVRIPAAPVVPGDFSEKGGERRGSRPASLPA